MSLGGGGGGGGGGWSVGMLAVTGLALAHMPVFAPPAPARVILVGTRTILPPMTSSDEYVVDATAMLRLLSLPSGAGEDEIRHAFREELKRLHPDGGMAHGPADPARLKALLDAHKQWQD